MKLYYPEIFFSAKAPVMDDPPVLRGPIETSSSTFSFYCDISYDHTMPHRKPRIEATFLFDGIEIPDGAPIEVEKADQYELLPVETDINNPPFSVELEDFYLTGRLGKNVSVTIGLYI